VIVHGRFSDFGAPVNWIAADIVRVETGKLAEHWHQCRLQANTNKLKGVGSSSMQRRPTTGGLKNQPAL
jgi:predicted SnoaL-like aldol condensation-catalyzing enzyme